MKYLVLVCLFVCSMSLQAAERSDEEAAVRETIQYYLDGYANGDVEKLKMAFRQDALIKYINPWNGKYSVAPMSELNEYMGKLPKNWKVSSRIDSVDVHGKAAAAKVTAKVEGMVVWTDYMNLLKIEDKWWIVDKVSHGDLPVKRSADRQPKG